MGARKKSPDAIYRNAPRKLIAGVPHFQRHCEVCLFPIWVEDNASNRSAGGLICETCAPNGFRSLGAGSRNPEPESERNYTG